MKGKIAKLNFIWKADIANSYIKKEGTDKNIFSIVENKRIKIFPFSEKKTYKIISGKSNPEYNLDWWLNTWNELTRQLKRENSHVKIKIIKIIKIN